MLREYWMFYLPEAVNISATEIIDNLFCIRCVFQGQEEGEDPVGSVVELGCFQVTFSCCFHWTQGCVGTGFLHVVDGLSFFCSQKKEQCAFRYVCTDFAQGILYYPLSRIYWSLWKKQNKFSGINLYIKVNVPVERSRYELSFDIFHS